MPGTTTTRRHISASPARVYRLLTDAAAVQRWKVPDGMTGVVHEFEPRVGGRFRLSLTYESPAATGKSSAHTDTYHGRFVALVPHSRIVETLAFETADPAMAGQMTVIYSLAPSANGTELVVIHEGVPDGIAPADNALGWRLSIAKLAALAESPDLA
jgi:uncharacterized protein YndB with AHSA1/START domain